MLAAGAVLRWVQLLVLDLRVSLWIKRSRVSDNRVSGLRIRTDEGLSKEAVPTVHPWKNGGAVCACNSTIIPLGAALPAARRCPRVCLVPAELRVSAWCQLGTDARDCLYLALNGRVLRARYTSPAF